MRMALNLTLLTRALVVVWIAGSWAAFAVAASAYLRLSTRLVELIGEAYPELWSKLWWTDWARQFPFIQSERGGRLERLVLFGLPRSSGIVDAQFDRLLRRARVAAFFFVSALSSGIVSLAYAPIVWHAA